MKSEADFEGRDLQGSQLDPSLTVAGLGCAVSWPPDDQLPGLSSPWKLVARVLVATLAKLVQFGDLW